MSTPTTKLTVMRGDTRRYNIRVTDADDAAVDFTGLQAAWFTVKHSRRDADSAKVLQKTLGSGIELVDAADGTVQLTLDATSLAALLPSRVYAWDMQFKLIGGDIVTPDYLTGSMVVEGDVTRAVA